MEQFLPAIIFSVVVAFIMMKQIRRVTERLDRQNAQGDAQVYAKFATLIQEHVRSIKMDIDSSKQNEHTIYQLNDIAEEEKALEFLSDLIRKLVFFETMNAKHKSPKEVEADLFTVLSELDTFLNRSIQDGEALAERLRDDLFEAYETLQEEQ